ncbi:MAG: response regulator transcription factor [Flavobacteriales bacterium]|jgi:DNA-binding NarL/FixJ family response regulator|nr:response regulator transcription factor [Flavobacteriales bacterium]
MSEDTIRIIIVEDDKEICDLIRRALEREQGMRVLAVYGSAEAYLEKFADLVPDVVLMDIGLPEMSGIECVAQAKPKLPSVQYVMSTVFENPAYIFQALCAGATGYLVKNAGQEQLASAVRELHEGGSPMSSTIARMVVDSFQNGMKAKIQDHALTDREKGILDQLAKGLMYKEIAANAGISTETVRKHVRNIYEKLQVGSRMEAIRKVYPSGAPS